jgi:hypothetical protein
MNDAKVVRFNLNIGITEKAYLSLSFGRRLEYTRKILQFCESAEQVYLSQKNQTFAKAIAEFKKLYKPKQWYVSAHSKEKTPNYYDDSFVVYYTT